MRATVRDRPVKLEDVNFLLERLRNYAYLWEEIGTALNFHPGALKNLRYSRQPATLLLKEVLVLWCERPTRDHPDIPTMEVLRDALASSLVGLPKIGPQLYQERFHLPSWQDKVCVARRVIDYKSILFFLR